MVPRICCFPEACQRGETVVIEGSLSLSKDYRYCTSDNCTSVAFADDVGLNWQHIQEVVLLAKGLASRVGTGPLPYK